LTGTTIYYAIEARRSRVAAQESARAARENLDLLKGQYEAQLGLGPQRVREALLSTFHLIAYWRQQIQPAQFNPNAVPNPEPLIKNDLMAVVDHARLISPELAVLLREVDAELRKAAGEFEKISKGVTYSTAAGGPGPYLDTAFATSNAAVAKLDEIQNK
jgi:hypothetical protein